jgi:sugar diacid utilization regulator
VLATLRPGRVGYIPPLRQHGVDHRLLVASMDVGSQRFGYLVIAETSGRFGPLDEAVARRAARTVALERSRGRLEDDREWHAVEALTGSLIRGEHLEISARAQALGVALDVPRAVCLLAARDGDMPGDLALRHVAHLLTDKESPSAVLAAWSGSDVALIVGVPRDLPTRGAVAWVKARFRGALASLSPDRQLCVAISTIVDGPRDDARAHREAQQVLRCVREHLSDVSAGVLASDDLGVARLLLATAGREEAQRFAGDALGLLLNERSVKSEELLITLDSFLRHGRSVRDCASELGVHPNTVRYRLTSIERQTHLAVSTDDDAYMTAQIAMVVARLGGRLGCL